MKKQIILIAVMFLIAISCKKESPQPVNLAPTSTTSAPATNDPVLIGKWYLDSVALPGTQDLVYYPDRVCGPGSNMAYLKFTSTVLSDYTCIAGSETGFDFAYITTAGYIVSDMDSVRYSYNGNVFIIAESYEFTTDENDSIYSWYSR